MTAKNEKKNEEDLKKINIFQAILFFIGMGLIVAFLLSHAWWPGLFFAPLLLFFGLLKFTTVGVQRAKIIERFRGFRKCIAELLPEEVLDEDYNIVLAATTKSRPKIHIIDQFFDSICEKYLGGIRLVGLRGIDNFKRGFHLRRMAYEITSNKDTEIVSHDEITDELYLQWDKYPVIIKKAETKEKERFVPSMEITFTARIDNPLTVVYIGDPNWPENVTLEVRGIIRDWTAGKTVDEIIAFKQSKTLWDEIKNHPNFKIIKDKWGIRIDEYGIQIMDIELPQDEQQALAASRKEELKAQGVAQQTAGTLLATDSVLTGKTIKKIQDEINEDTEKLNQYRQEARELIAQRISADSGSLLHFKTDGKPGPGTDIITLLAAGGQIWNRNMHGGKQPSSEVKEKTGQDGTKSQMAGSFTTSEGVTLSWDEDGTTIAKDSTGKILYQYVDSGSGQRKKR